MFIVLLPFFVCLAGLLLYLTEDPRSQTIGLHMFWVGLLVFLLYLNRIPLL